MSSVFRKPADADRNTKATVYIGNLDPQVTELLLFELLVQFAPVKSLNFPKDRILKTHQGYGFAEFRTVQDAEYVLEICRGIRLFGKMLKINKTEQNASKPASGTSAYATSKRLFSQIPTQQAMDVGAKLFIKNLSPLIDEAFLSETFSKFGTLIKTPVIIRSDDGESKGYGFLTYEDFSMSDEAIEKMNGGLLMNMKVSISYAFKDEVSQGQRVRHGDRTERLLAENAKSNKADGGDKKRRKK